MSYICFRNCAYAACVYIGADVVPSSWPWNFSRFIVEMANPRWEAFEMVAD